MATTTLGVHDLANPEGLSKEFLTALDRVLGRLTPVDEAAAATTLRYIVDGGSDQVLLTLGGLKGAANTLLLKNHALAEHPGRRQEATNERAALFRAAQMAPPAVWIRLGHVLEAIDRAAGATVQAAEGRPVWFQLLFAEIAAAVATRTPDSHTPGWTMDDLTSLLRTSDLPEDLLARSCLQSGGYFVYRMGSVPGWFDYLTRYLGVFRATLAREAPDTQLLVLRYLKETTFDFSLVADLLVAVATASAKGLRDNAWPVLRSCRDWIRPFLERALAEGDARSRNEAAQLLWRLYDTDAVAQLRSHRAGEASERVQQTIDQILAAPPEETAAPPKISDTGDPALPLPPLRLVLGTVELPEEAKAGLAQFFQEDWEEATREYEEALRQWQAPDRPTWMSRPRKPEPLNPVMWNQFLRFVEGKDAQWPGSDLPYYANRPLGDWLAPPGVHLIHFVRLLLATRRLWGGEDWWFQDRDMEEYRSRCRPPFGLRELDATLATLPGGKPGMLARRYLQNNEYKRLADWEPEAVWPLFAEQREMLREVLDPSTQKAGVSSDLRRNAFNVLGMMPRLPPGFLPLLWDIALGNSKPERPLAQAALHTVPDKASRIVVALGDGRHEVRGAAAEWLGRLGDAVAIAPLEQAFRKEDNEFTKGLILTALERLGADIGKYLDRNMLLDESVAGLARKRPKGMEWVPLDTLPALHWQDNGEAVDPRIVQWWLVQAIHQKTPTPGPLLRRYLGQCRTSETEALARFVLSVWLARNVLVRTSEEAAAAARAETDQRFALYGKNPTWLQAYNNDKEVLYKILLPEYAREYLASALGEKGMLAIPATVGDRSCVQRCEQFIRAHAQDRPLPCAVLVEVLGWMPHPLALQVLLSLSIRYRTKQIGKLSEQYIQSVAEREGWTVDELGDRTIPDAGFARPVNEHGAPTSDQAALVLDYGLRHFTVTLDDDLEPVISTVEGKVVKSLPTPAKSDDADKAKAARKAFTDAKKLVNEVATLQSERLYQALCTQRSWTFADWHAYLAQHPIVGRLCTRLAWAAFRQDANEGEGGGTFLGCFRPLEDRTLTNEKDEEVHYDPGVRVRLAHDCNTPADLHPAWVRHFTDYDITPLFAQFGRAAFVLTEDKRKSTEIEDFKGHCLTTFQLLGQATKRGWVCGDAEDNGVFRIYRKPFPSLGLQALLEFTGTSMSAPDRPAALKELFFAPLKNERAAGSSWGQARLPLVRVPPVLLTEIYSDVQAIAAAGSGYDPEWRKKV